jgi:hypothetical protein
MGKSTEFPRHDQKMRDFLEATYEGEGIILLEGGHDNAVLGIVQACGYADRLCYDLAIVMDNLVADGMDELEANEWTGFNILGAHLGDSSPVYLEKKPWEYGE